MQNLFFVLFFSLLFFGARGLGQHQCEDLFKSTFSKEHLTSEKKAEAIFDSYFENIFLFRSSLWMPQAETDSLNEYQKSYVFIIQSYRNLFSKLLKIEESHIKPAAPELNRDLYFLEISGSPKQLNRRLGFSSDSNSQLKLDEPELYFLWLTYWINSYSTKIDMEKLLEWTSMNLLHDLNELDPKEFKYKNPELKNRELFVQYQKYLL